DLAQRADDPLVTPPADECRAGGGQVEAEDEPHRGGLACAVRAEEAGHGARAYGECELVDRRGRAEALGQVLDLDHGLFGVKNLVDSRRQSRMTTASPISQTTTGYPLTRAFSGLRRLASSPRVSRPKKTVPVILAALLPRLLACAI